MQRAPFTIQLVVDVVVVRRRCRRHHGRRRCHRRGRRRRRLQGFGTCQIQLDRLTDLHKQGLAVRHNWGWGGVGG